MQYGRANPIGPFDLAFEEGTTTVLLGTSGGGKSTLLKLLNGLVVPIEGEVLFRGRPLREEDRLQLGYVVQGGGLFPHLTAASNIALVARHLHWETARIETRLRELSALVRLPFELLSRYPAQLSGGQAQRVGLMRALMLDPPVMLLDEPLGALDPITRFDLQNDLRDVFARLHKTVMLVTHDLGEAAFFGGRVLLLHDGRIEQEGKIEDLVNAPKTPFVERFVHAQRGLT
ncbi:MAG TPA: ATP-binding cassette domain-containing protein [Myxococcales bacterium]|jgi:osmoprotectant transport system ATP-binding protein